MSQVGDILYDVYGFLDDLIQQTKDKLQKNNRALMLYFYI